MGKLLTLRGQSFTFVSPAIKKSGVSPPDSFNCHAGKIRLPMSKIKRATNICIGKYKRLNEFVNRQLSLFHLNFLLINRCHGDSGLTLNVLEQVQKNPALVVPGIFLRFVC